MVANIFFCFLFWSLGFFLSVGLALPFVSLYHIKGFAASACSDIRGL